MATIMAMIALASPLLITESDAYSENQNGIIVTTVEEGPIIVDVNSGESTTVQLFVTNTTAHHMGVVVSTSEFTSDITTTVSAPTLLGASGDENAVGTILVTLEADQYASNVTIVGNILVTVRDTTGTEPQVFTIPVTVDITSALSSENAYNKFFGVIPNTLGEPFNSPLVTSLITFILWIVATVIIAELVIPILGRLVGVRKTAEEKKKLTKQLTTTITSLMIIIAVNECAQILGAGPEIVYLIGGLSKVLYVILGAIIAWQIYLFIITAFLKGLDENAEMDGMDMSLLPLFKMLGKLLISVVGVCIALSAFGVDLAGIMVSAGVVTLGITLGAQNTLNQFFSGIVMLATRPFKKGDFVKINGEVYIVRKVKLMFTEFASWDVDQIVTIPNNVVSSGTIVNLTQEFGRTRVYAYIDVAYGSDIETVKQCLVNAGMKHPHTIKDGSCSLPNARLTEFAASGITFRLACYVDDFDNSSHYNGQLRELIYKELTENGIEIPYNRIQVDVLSSPEDHLRQQNGA